LHGHSSALGSSRGGVGRGRAGARAGTGTLSTASGSRLVSVALSSSAGEQGGDDVGVI
jgi:methyl coenzyme M reductase subunit C